MLLPQISQVELYKTFEVISCFTIHKVYSMMYNRDMTIEYEYPIHPDRTYRIDIDGEKYFITGANLIALVLDKISE